MYNEELFEVIFTYSSDVPRRVRADVEQAFMLARRYALELINPNLRKWNIDFWTNHEVYVPEYETYIQDRKNEVLEIFNQMWGGPVTLFADEYGDIAGRFTLKKFRRTEEIIMHVELKPRPKQKLYDLLKD